MVELSQFRKVFADKLLATNDFDAAFGKAIWLAFNEGLKEGLQDTRQDKARCLQEVESVLTKGYSR
jgi:hypothetical protein